MIELGLKVERSTVQGKKKLTASQFGIIRDLLGDFESFCLDSIRIFSVVKSQNHFE